MQSKRLHVFFLCSVIFLLSLNLYPQQSATPVDKEAVRVGCQVTEYTMEPGQVDQAAIIKDPAGEQAVLFDLVEGGAIISLKYHGIEHVWGFNGGGLLQMAFHHSIKVGNLMGDYNPTQAGDGSAMSPVTGVACQATQSINLMTVMLDFNHNNGFYDKPLLAVWNGRVNDATPLSTPARILSRRGPNGCAILPASQNTICGWMNDSRTLRMRRWGRSATILPNMNRGNSTCAPSVLKTALASPLRRSIWRAAGTKARTGRLAWRWQCPAAISLTARSRVGSIAITRGATETSTLGRRNPWMV